MIDDGVNDEAAFYQACEKLKAEGFWEEVKRKYGTKPSVSSSKQPSQGLQKPQVNESKRV